MSSGTGTVKSEATNTSVQQHRILASVIYHFKNVQ